MKPVATGFNMQPAMVTFTGADQNPVRPIGLAHPGAIGAGRAQKLKKQGFQTGWIVIRRCNAILKHGMRPPLPCRRNSDWIKFADHLVILPSRL